jgi:hypothetical protein
LTLGHHRDQLVELVLGEIGADLPETPSYVFANCFLTEKVNLFEA